LTALIGFRFPALARWITSGYKSSVRLEIHVTAPPQKPLLIYDGECNFCALWVRRWKHSTGERVDYLPFQDPLVAARFPELPRKGLETAVHLVETDGSVFCGAEGAFRALGHANEEPLLLDFYLRSSVFARLSECVYRFIARRRQLFSFLTRVAWGRHVEPPSHILVRWVFLRSLALIYLIAFLSLWVQLMGLVGSNGILPATLIMFGYRQEAAAAHLGWDRYRVVPTLDWFSASDGFLKLQCATGTGLAVLLILGIAPAPCLFLLWLIYLSLTVVCAEFLSYQWDILLLEVGFLAVFFAPLQWLPWVRPAPPPSKIVVWLLRWLLFRLMFCSGLAKLLGGDPTWRNLTALKFHHETQPLPTWIGWYAHQLPTRVQQASTFLMFVVEVALPFLIFAPRRVRQVPFVGFTILQVLILLTGNYGFFNFLTLALCLMLLDDAALAGFIPVKWLRRIEPAPQTSGLDPRLSEEPLNPAGASQLSSNAPAKPTRPRRWPIQVTFPLMCLAILIPAVRLGGTLGLRIPWPSPILFAYKFLTPLRIFNQYGLFQIMTTNRFEIIIQGSNDGMNWQDYEFKYKPGNPNTRPGFVEPHQPRLDWQMWFAALGDYQQNPWLVEFCARLLNGSPQAIGLLARNPFPRAPPRYLRAMMYEYHFTDFAERRRTGAWWRRELKGQYLPVLSMQKEPMK
jgi:predicted DCC family thiol-disulfide oxidoreductase YuxK